MTKLRDPRSEHDALDQAIGFLGAPEAAKAVGKSEHLLRKWSDPESDDRNAPLSAAIKLDTALVQRGFPAVFAELLTWHADQARPVKAIDAAMAPEPKHLAVSRIVSGAAQLLDDFVVSESHLGLASADCASLLMDTERLQKKIGAFRRQLIGAQAASKNAARKK